MVDWFSKTEVKKQEVNNEEIVFCGVNVGTVVSWAAEKSSL